MNWKINRKGFSLAEIMVVMGIFLVMSAGLLGTMVVIRNSYFRSSGQIDLQQQARYGMARMIDEIAQTASGKVSIYKCPSGICEGGAIAFQVPVTTTKPISGSIYKFSTQAIKPIKWGFDGREMPASDEIIYMVPAVGGPFSAYQNQLIRITRKSYCPDGNCDASAGEDNGNCNQDCYCGNDTCDPGESGSCGTDCPSGSLHDFWFRNLFGDGIAFGQTAPDISEYYDLPGLLNPANYTVRVITTDVSAVYFLGTPGPGREGGSAGSKPDIVEIVMIMSKPGIFAPKDIDLSFTSSVALRNLSF